MLTLVIRIGKTEWLRQQCSVEDLDRAIPVIGQELATMAKYGRVLIMAEYAENVTRILART